jgi:hypothetical protein
MSVLVPHMAFGLERTHDGHDSRVAGVVWDLGRHVLLQAAWKYRQRPAIGAALRARQVDQPAAVIAQAWKAQHRLWRRSHRLHHAKPAPVAVTLVGFLWVVLQQQAPAAVA